MSTIVNVCSDEFWEYFRKKLQNKIVRDFNSDPRREDIDLEPYKHETVKAIILGYLSPEQSRSISEDELKYIITFVRGLFMLGR